MFTNEQWLGDICKNINEKLPNTERLFCKDSNVLCLILMLCVSDSLFPARCPSSFLPQNSSFSSVFSQATVSSFWTPPDALVWFCFQISVVFRSRSSITAVYSLFFRLKRTSIRIWNIPMKKKTVKQPNTKSIFRFADLKSLFGLSNSFRFSWACPFPITSHMIVTKRFEFEKNFLTSKPRFSSLSPICFDVEVCQYLEIQSLCSIT